MSGWLLQGTESAEEVERKITADGEKLRRLHEAGSLGAEHRCLRQHSG